MQITDNHSCVEDLWRFIGEIIEATPETSSDTSNLWFSTITSKLVSSTAKSINRMIENRGGMAQISGLIMIPSQFCKFDSAKSHEIINALKVKRVEKFCLEIDEGTLDGIIYYPKNWNKEDYSCCVLYNNPNGITVAGYFDNGCLKRTPKQIFDLESCPVILYDYRGTGLSKSNESNSSTAFFPTYKTISEDGLGVLQFALNRFRMVKVWGSSLGGGVATVALDHHLNENPEDENRVTLINHDSFTKTIRVVLNRLPIVTDMIGSLVGANLDAQTAMEKLINRGIKITVLCHLRDPIIPSGARMSEYVSGLSRKDNVHLIESPLYGHANLSGDMCDDIRGLSYQD